MENQITLRKYNYFFVKGTDFLSKDKKKEVILDFFFRICIMQLQENLRGYDFRLFYE